MSIPKYDELFNPLLLSLHKLGGSASISEQEDEVVSILGLTDKEASEIHRGNRTKLSYRLAWARNYLKRYGILENSERGVWSLTSKGLSTENVDKEEVNQFVKLLDKKNKNLNKIKDESVDSENQPWKDELLELIKGIKPDAFERLCQRILREKGFINVEVTGRSGDGGIDGKGVLTTDGLISFPMIFQCKRHQGSISSGMIRDFRGAMVGRVDKGLFITTSTFTKSAREEAQREGAPLIDLVDGESLANILKEIKLGIKIEEKIVEIININKNFYENI